MRDRSRRGSVPAAKSGSDGFERYAASLIVVSGGGVGEEHVIQTPCWLVGRGPDVDVAFADPKMSQRHLRIEFARGRFQAIDLDSTNGTRVNGTEIAAAELVHGDRIQAGAHVFQILIERIESRPAPQWSAERDVASRIQ